MKIRNVLLTAAAALMASATAQTEVNVWIYETFAGDDAAIYRTVEDFHAANPDIRINLIPTAYSSSSYRDPFIIAAQGGSGPDVLMVDIAWTPEFAAMGIVANLDERFAGGKADEFFAGPMETVAYEGSIFGVPFYTNALGMYYNKTAFEEAGLPLPEQGWTWEDFRTAVDTLSDGEMYGFGLQGAWGGTFEWYPWLWQAGGELLDENGGPAFNSAEGLEATTFFLDIVTNPEYVPEAAKTWRGWAELAAAFSNNVIAMFEAGDWSISIVEQSAPDFEWGVAHLPSHRTSASLVGGANWVINSNTRVEDAAWRFVEYVTSDAVYPLLDGYNRMAARRGALTGQEIVVNDPRMQVFAESLDYARPRPTNPLWTSTDYDCIQPAFMQVILEGRDVNEAMAEAELCAVGVLNR